MSTSEFDQLNSVLFGGAGHPELKDFKCFRGDRVNITAEELVKELHSVHMQRKTKRADVSSKPPELKVEKQDIKELLATLT